MKKITLGLINYLTDLLLEADYILQVLDLEVFIILGNHDPHCIPNGLYWCRMLIHFL